MVSSDSNKRTAVEDLRNNKRPSLSGKEQQPQHPTPQYPLAHGTATEPYSDRRPRPPPIIGGAQDSLSPSGRQGPRQRFPSPMRYPATASATPPQGQGDSPVQIAYTTQTAPLRPKRRPDRIVSVPQMNGQETEAYFERSHNMHPGFDMSILYVAHKSSARSATFITDIPPSDNLLWTHR